MRGGGDRLGGEQRQADTDRDTETETETGVVG